MGNLHPSWRSTFGSELDRRTPEFDHVLANLLISSLPSTPEVERGGKRVVALRERFRTLSAAATASEILLADHAPGIHQRCIVVAFRGLRIATLGDLLVAPIGKWHDLQLLRGDAIVAASVREERIVLLASKPLPMRDCYGEVTPLAAELHAFLRA